MWRDPIEPEPCAPPLHPVEDIHFRGPADTWARCACGVTIRRTDPEAVATAYAGHAGVMTFEELVEKDEAGWA